ncbi:YcxB family protein [Herpetosiphon llansteffanensis]|uniref:YcxB family protein n=1 Tax=Herpetosiphon llansteffanensis TaxID=2094568 RepID=UPI000D7CEDAC|nr:YcxB family protein [Herpetosiphon llansteffanensis]
MEPIILNYQLDFTDYQAANLAMFKHSPRYQQALNLNRYYELLLYVLGAASIAFFIAALIQVDHLIVWLIVLGLILLSSWIVYSHRDMREFTLEYLKKNYRNEQASFELPTTFMSDSMHIKETNPCFISDFKWNFIQTVLNETEHILLISHNNRVVVIPKRAFKSPADQQMALQQFAQYHADAQLAE